MTVEGDGLWDIQALHDYEAEGVAEGVGLVLVRTEEGDSAGLIRFAHSLDLATATLDGIEEREGIGPPAVGTVDYEGVGFDDHHVRRDELPVLWELARAKNSMAR